MNPEEWLTRKAIGYSDLSRGERDAIAHFSLLWSLFEAIQLENNANPAAIIEKVDQWSDIGVLHVANLAESLAYFSNRYYENGVPTYHFEDLNFRPNLQRDLVVEVMSGARETPREIMIALLLIIYRLRNNLFHGEKWADGIANQRSNFDHANSILMSALELP